MTKYMYPGLALLTAILTLMPNLSFAGGSAGGGGHYIEAQFVAKLHSIVNHIMRYGKDARSKLDPRIKPAELLIALKNQDLFKALCATHDPKNGDELKFLIDHQKMAYVFNFQPHIVRLDCEPNMYAKWDDLFKSHDPAETYLFLHEGLRVLGVEGENGYGISSTYVDAENEEKIDDQKILRRLIDDNNSQNNHYPLKCMIDSEIGGNGVFVVSIDVPENKAIGPFESLYTIFENRDFNLEKIIFSWNTKDKKILEFRKRALEIAREFCGFN